MRLPSTHQLESLGCGTQPGVQPSSVLILGCSLPPHLARGALGDDHGLTEVCTASLKWKRIRKLGTPDPL